MDISMILSGLALLAATANLVLTIQEKKRNQKRNAAALHYVQNECNAVSLAAAQYTNEEVNKAKSEFSTRFTDEELGLWEELNRRFDETNGKLDELSDTVSSYDEEIPFMKKNLQDLMQGIVPDFEEAVKAASAVDNLSSYISNMLNFDPLEEARKARLRRRDGGESE